MDNCFDINGMTGRIFTKKLLVNDSVLSLEYSRTPIKRPPNKRPVIKVLKSFSVKYYK